MFEYDCSHGKVIDPCLCGSTDCIGRVAGYRYLSIEEKQKRVHFVEVEVLEALAADSTNRFLYIPDLRCPTDRVAIEPVGEESYKLVASRDFKGGEVVYSNEALLYSTDCAIVVEVCGKRKWIDNVVYTVNLGEGKRAFYYFDSFQNHSCDPNTTMIYHSETAYSTIASQDISEGDEITSDYESFDAGLDGTSFNCQCDAKKCRGIVKA